MQAPDRHGLEQDHRADDTNVFIDILILLMELITSVAKARKITRTRLVVSPGFAELVARFNQIEGDSLTRAVGVVNRPVGSSQP